METIVSLASLLRVSPAMVIINLSFFFFFLNLIDFVSDVPLLSPCLSPIFNLHSTGVSGCVRAPCEEEG